MAFTRAFLKTMNLTDEQVNAIMEEHTAVTSALKDQRDAYKADAEQLPAAQQEIERLKAFEGYQAKFDSEHAAFEEYKAKVAADAEAEKVRAAYRRLLAEEKVSDKRFDAILKVTDLSGMKLGKDGGLEDADKLRESIRSEWSDFVVKTEERVPKPETPPADNNGGKPLSRAAELAAQYHAQKYGASNAQKE